MTTTNGTYAEITFRVQIVGIDDEGKGPLFFKEAEAIEYATLATANGHKAVIARAW
jgi:hypothetical protein